MEKENKPIVIGMYVGKWLGGGVESVVMNYYEHIDKSKIQFDFICDNDSTNIPYDRIKELGGRVILVPPYQKQPKHFIELIKLFKKNKYRIVHSHVNAGNVEPLFAAYIARVPIRIAHSHSTSNRKETLKNLLKGILKPFNKIFATHYFACSEYAGRWLFGNKTFDKGLVTVINNAINLGKFKYDENIRTIKRKELNINDKTLVIGHIGRFVAQKNHTFLIDIFNEVQKREPDSVLLLIGQGSKQEEIKEKVKNLGLTKKVKFLGQRTDVSELYQAMDIFILPSLYEGLGMVLIEAQASGLPCIASTEVPSIAQVSSHFAFLDLDAKLYKWGDKIIEFSKLKRENNIEEIRDSGFDITKETKKLEEKYAEIIK